MKWRNKYWLPKVTTLSNICLYISFNSLLWENNKKDCCENIVWRARYKYINPSVPPPGYQEPQPSSTAQTNSSSWRSQVDDFLSRPKTKSTSPRSGRSKFDSESGPDRSKRKVDWDSDSERAKKRSFTPKAQILAPSPQSGGTEANELDTRPEDKIYLGEISVTTSTSSLYFQ